MGNYLRSIIPQHLAESKAWLEFIDAFNIVLTKTESRRS